MADITTLRNQYFAQTATSPGEQVPHTSGGNVVKSFIDGPAFFAEVNKEVTALQAGGSNRFFYLAGWWLGLVNGPSRGTVDETFSAWTIPLNLASLTAFRLTPTSPTLLGQLSALAVAGVDVRIIPWVSPIIPDEESAGRQAGGLFGVNVHSLLSARALRAAAGLGNSVVLNTTAHPLGGIHAKFLVCGDATRMRSYTSGLDVVSNRLNEHTTDDQGWHDAGVSVEGPASGAIYNFFRDMWNEQLRWYNETFYINGATVDSFTSETTAVPDRTPPPPTTTPATQHVQVLRTVPMMNLTMSSPRVPVSGYQKMFVRYFQHPWAIDTDRNGIFEFRLALRSAIAGARNYIYMEDQGFTGLEIMEWINAQLKAYPALKVIMLHGADPADPPNPTVAESVDRLCAGVTNASSRIAFYEQSAPIAIHSKLFVIDDMWTSIGSANHMRRSLYTDAELSVSVLDEATVPFAQKLRMDLWMHLCNAPSGSTSASLQNLSSALGLWKSTWGTPPSGFALKPSLVSMKVPFVYSGANPPAAGEWPGVKPVFNQAAYDLVDPDSRQEY